MHKITDKTRAAANILISVGNAKNQFAQAVVVVTPVSKCLLLAQNINGFAARKLVKKRQEKRQAGSSVSEGL